MKTVYLITKVGEKTFWNRVGVAFTNKDGSQNLKIDMFPGVTFQVREAKSKTKKK